MQHAWSGRTGLKFSVTGTDLNKGLVGEDSLPGYGSVTLVKRPVRSRMQGVGGAGGEKPPATRLSEDSLFAFHPA